MAPLLRTYEVPLLRLSALTLTVLLLAGTGPPVSASVAIVPDDFPTIQAAIDSRPDTVRIRAGSYDEHPVVDLPVVLEGVEGGVRIALTVSPNPSFGRVSIAWAMPKAGEVHARVYDLAGRHVASPSRGRFEAGQHLVHWDGRQENGALAPAGWYVVKLLGPGVNLVRRVMLVR